MGWLSRLFNWKMAVEMTATDALNIAVEEAKQRINEGSWTKTQQVQLKEGVDLLAALALAELRKRIN